MSRPTTGIRRIDALEGGLLACLYGPTDLDDVLLAMVQELAMSEDGQESWIAKTWHEPDFAFPVAPDAPIGNDAAWKPWQEACDLWRKAGRWTIDEEHETGAILEGYEVEAGWYRKTPCPPQMCGEHSWHWHHANEGDHAAFLGVLLSGSWA